jgi:tRNA nucleotidyltransferase (CCA-adding enzyme)
MDEGAGVQDDRGWDHFPHDADIGIRGYGPTIEIAYEQAARALTAVITDHEVAAKERVTVQCEAPDAALLLVEWLNALVYEMASRKMLFGDFSVSIEGHALTGTAWGEPVAVARHQPAVEVKGATYTCLEVTRGEDGRWHAQCVIDV